jgi:hypothetical protein
VDPAWADYTIIVPDEWMEEQFGKDWRDYENGTSRKSLKTKTMTTILNWDTFKAVEVKARGSSRTERAGPASGCAARTLITARPGSWSLLCLRRRFPPP